MGMQNTYTQTGHLGIQPSKSDLIWSSIVIFLYVFSFFIVGSITSSHIVAAVLAIFLFDSRYMAIFQTEIRNSYFLGILTFLIFLIFLSFCYSTFHNTNDYSYIKTLLGQFVHLLCGAFIISFLIYRVNINPLTLIQCIVLAYIAQSCIEIIASFVEPVREFVRLFQGGEIDDGFSESMVRGLALSSAVGWSLGLSYGLVFIIFTRRYMLESISYKTIILWMLLFIGVFFAGRTGFVGVLVGIVYYFLFNTGHIEQRIIPLVKLLSLVLITIFVLWICAPGYIEYQLEYVLPFAFEPIYNYLDGKGFTTGSTDILVERMWKIEWTWDEFITGTGWWEYNGAYFRGTDAGILRNLLYWGILGYGCLIAYELYIMSPLFKSRIFRTMAFFILIYICVAEYKAVTIGLNKQIFSILFLLGNITYYYNAACNHNSQSHGIRYNN